MNSVGFLIFLVILSNILGSIHEGVVCHCLLLIKHCSFVLFCTIICIIFTSLCKNLVKLTRVLAEAFRCHGHHFQCLAVLVELAAKTLVSLTRFLQSEVKIIHIIVQDQDGQNNNI